MSEPLPLRERRALLTRRALLGRAAAGLGGLALDALLSLSLIHI